MIIYKNGDLLAPENNLDIIAHQVNCMGIMGGGIAKTIRTTWPRVYEIYKAHCEKYSPEYLLGRVQFVRPHFQTLEGEMNYPIAVANIFSQQNISKQGEQATDYKALNDALWNIAETMREKEWKTIGLPYGIGCGLGGGDWSIVEEFIENSFGMDPDLTCYIYKL
jgi:O-acetyl-ADP-ribose deacetylase (regulator of RNase III)